MSTLRAVDRTFSILRIVADSPDGVGVNAIARATDLPTSTASRILAALEGWEVVLRTDDNLFQIGPELVRLVGQQPFTQTLSTLARPVLQNITDLTGEAVALCILDDQQTYYLDHVQSPQAIRVKEWTGEHLPLHVAAPGKIFLAYSTDEFMDEVLAKPLVRYASQTIIEADILRRHLTQIRQKGYAISDEEFEDGVLGFGTPIRDSTSQVVAAFNLYGPKFRLEAQETQQQVIKVLRDATAELEEKLL